MPRVAFVFDHTSVIAGQNIKHAVTLLHIPAGSHILQPCDPHAVHLSYPRRKHTLCERRGVIQSATAASALINTQAQKKPSGFCLKGEIAAAGAVIETTVTAVIKARFISINHINAPLKKYNNFHTLGD